MTPKQLFMLMPDDIVGHGWEEGRRQFRNVGVVQRIYGEGRERRWEIEWVGSCPGISTETMEGMCETIAFICTQSDVEKNAELSEMLVK